MGTASDIVYKQGDHSLALPIAVIAKFNDTFTGPSLALPKCVPIIPETNECDLYGSSNERQQLRLKLPWAISIHKLQGLTIDKTRVDLGKPEKFTGLTYVGLSRVRKLDDLIVEFLIFDRLQSVKSETTRRI